MPLVMRLSDHYWYLFGRTRVRCDGRLYHRCSGCSHCRARVPCNVDLLRDNSSHPATMYSWQLVVAPAVVECRVIQGLHSAKPTVSSSKPLDAFQCRTVGVLEPRLQSTGRDRSAIQDIIIGWAEHNFASVATPRNTSSDHRQGEMRRMSSVTPAVAVSRFWRLFPEEASV